MQAEDNKLLEEIGELLAIHYEDWQIQEHSGPEVAFGRYLRSLRRNQQLTIAEVAHQAKLPESEILAYERGLIPQRLIKVVSLKALAETLDEEIDTFLLLLEANLSSESSPKPPAANGDRAGGNYGHRLFPGFKYDDHLDITGAVATLEGKNRLVGNSKTAHTAQSTTLLTMHTATAPPKCTLRQVVADPLWQIKIYRVWAPLTIFVLIICLQVSIFYPRGKAGHHSLSSTAVKSGPTNPSQSPHIGGPSIEASYNPLPKDVLLATQGISTVAQAPAPKPTVPDKGMQQSTKSEHEKQTAELVPFVDISLPIIHEVDDGENWSCIAKQYYGSATFYPLICLYNFGDAQCTKPVPKGELVEIPAFEDFKREPQINQSLANLPNTLVDSFKAISKSTINTNQVEHLRGIDYFCQAGDYERFGEKWVLSGQVKDPENRIPGWSSTKG